MSEPTRRGLSMVEVLVLTGVVGVGGLLALPPLRAAHLFARQARCADNLRQLGLAAHYYESVMGVFPMSRVQGEGRGVGHSAHTLLLPFVEQASAYNAYNFWLEPHDDSNRTAVGVKLAVLLCPDLQEESAVEPLGADKLPTPDGKGLPGENVFARAHYGYNWGGGREGSGLEFAREKGTYLGLVVPVLTAEGKRRGVTRNISLTDAKDGLSYTLLAAERRGGGGWAYGGPGGSEYDVHTSPDYDGDDPRAAAFLTGSAHPRGPNVLFGDGSVRTLAPKLERPIWYALQTRAGGEVIRPEDLTP